MERRIQVLTDIKDLNELLAGASVDRTQVVSHPGQTQLIVELTRAMIERQTTVRQGLFQRLKTPFSKCQLTFASIRAVTTAKTDVAPSAASDLMACEPVKNGYRLTIRSGDGTEIALDVDTLNGRFEDVGQPVEAP